MDSSPIYFQKPSLSTNNLVSISTPIPDGRFLCNTFMNKQQYGLPNSSSVSSLSTLEEFPYSQCCYQDSQCGYQDKMGTPFSINKELAKKESRKLSHEQIKAKYKTELCKYYELNLGYCKFGDNVIYYIYIF